MPGEARRRGPIQQARLGRKGHADKSEDDAIAEILVRIAGLLEVQGSNPFRPRAYRDAAAVVLESPRPIRQILATEGLEGLQRLPKIGRNLASTIREIVDTGRSRFLDHLEGRVCPEVLFRSIPGVGPVLAKRLHLELHLDSLEDLEVAAHDGRLQAMSGVGARRAAAFRSILDSMLTKTVRRRHGAREDDDAVPPPPVSLLLDIDNEYRVGADLGALPTIAPRRFNPRRAPWLPILHGERDGWAVTAMYSNSARAHETKSTHDWVVLYYERDGYDGQCTVVTETRGPLFGQRVIRGREIECKNYYDAAAIPTEPVDPHADHGVKHALPVRSGGIMPDTEWGSRIQRLGGFENRDAADAAARAVLGALGSVLTEEEGEHVKDVLPRVYRDAIESYPGATDSLEAFYADVARREGVRLSVAIEHAQVVCRVLTESAPAELRTLLTKRLPAFAEALFTIGPPPPPVEAPERHGELRPHSSRLAGGRPGSEHPVSEAPPARAHPHSIAASDDPHGDTKLSSAKGLTQEREHETLAAGRPGRRS